MAAPTLDGVRQLEAQVLGAALLDPEACAALVSALPSERYLEPRHARLAETVERLFAEGSPVNPHTATVSGADADLVAACVASVASTGNVAFNAALLTEAFMARETATQLTIALKAAQRAVAGDGDVFDVLDRAQGALASVALSAKQGAQSDTHIRHAVAEALVRVEEWRRGEGADFAPSGFYSLDRTTGGLPVGELTTIAAMTGAGKTSLLGQAMRSVALAELAAVEAERRERARPVVCFSAEMSREQLVHRMASGLAGVNIRVLRAGKGTPEQYARYDAALGRLAALEVYVDDNPSPSFTHIAARLTQIGIRSEGELAFVGVDYDEKVESEGQTEELRVSAIARGLKDTAKRFRCPVVALSQYGRKEGMHKLPPSNAWLRYSGKKEQESAQIIHWIYPQYWVEKGYDPNKVYGNDLGRPERGQLFVSKNRFGPTGEIPLDFHVATTSFRDPGEPGQRYTAAELARRPQAGRDAARPTEGQARAQDADDLADAGATPPNHEPPF